jgi:hypothetical protein
MKLNLSWKARAALRRSATSIMAVAGAAQEVRRRVVAPRVVAPRVVGVAAQRATSRGAAALGNAVANGGRQRFTLH